MLPSELANLNSHTKKVPDTFLSIFRSRLGVSRLSELSETGPTNREILDAIPESYSRWVGSFVEPPPRPLGTLRPLVAPVTGLNPFDEAATAAQMLLTCHSVAVQIPDTLSYMQRLVRLFFLLEDEIEQGLVVLIPDSGSIDRVNANSRWFDLQTNRSLQSRADRDDFLRWSGKYFAGFEVAIGLDLCAAYPDRLDLACRTAEQSRVLKELLQASGESMPEPIVRAHDSLHYLPDLLALSLPCFDLSVHDLVTIRRDGLFDAWHNSLRHGLASVRALPADQLLDPQSARRIELSHYMLAAADDVARQVKRSSVLRAAKMGTMNFGIACAFGALAAVGAGPVVGGAVGGGGFLANTIVSWLGSRPASGERAFRRLAVEVFTPPRA